MIIVPTDMQSLENWFTLENQRLNEQHNKKLRFALNDFHRRLSKIVGYPVKIDKLLKLISLIPEEYAPYQYSYRYIQEESPVDSTIYPKRQLRLVIEFSNGSVVVSKPLHLDHVGFELAETIEADSVTSDKLEDATQAEAE